MVIVPGTWCRLGWICRGLFRLRIVEIGKMFIPTYLPVLLSLIIVGSHSLILNYLYFNYVFIFVFSKDLKPKSSPKICDIYCYVLFNCRGYLNVMIRSG